MRGNHNTKFFTGTTIPMNVKELYEKEFVSQAEGLKFITPMMVFKTDFSLETTNEIMLNLGPLAAIVEIHGLAPDRVLFGIYSNEPILKGEISFLAENTGDFTFQKVEKGSFAGFQI